MKKKIVLVILFLIVSLIGTGLVYGFNTISQINQMVAEPKMNEADLNVNNDLDIDTINIAVFGVDGRSDIEGDRTDTIMIVSMDFRNGNIKVTSVMRDLLVQIPKPKIPMKVSIKSMPPTLTADRNWRLKPSTKILI